VVLTCVAGGYEVALPPYPCHSPATYHDGAGMDAAEHRHLGCSG
jgi:hypothetical protein